MKYNIKNINRRIARIKDLGLTPVTLKSPADIIEKIVNQKGTGTEGLIMSYREAQFTALYERNEQLTIEEYNRSLQIFMEGYKEQTYVKGAIDTAYKDGMKTLQWIYEDDSYFDLQDRMENLSKKDLIKMLQDVGNEMRELKSQKQNTAGYVSKEEFTYLIDQWLENRGK